MALGVLRAMREAGRDVPGDVSVVGFDDIPEAAYFNPPLTTVRQDFIEVGSRSLRALVRVIETGERERYGSRIPTELIVRDSTSVPSIRPNRKKIA
jgi:DNA-binding LacI/PurR family transcriptional regulator